MSQKGPDEKIKLELSDLIEKKWSNFENELEANHQKIKNLFDAKKEEITNEKRQTYSRPGLITLLTFYW